MSRRRKEKIVKFDNTNPIYKEIRNRLLTAVAAGENKASFLSLVSIETNKDLLITLTPSPPITELPNILKNVARDAYEDIGAVPDYVGSVILTHYTKKEQPLPDSRNISDIIKGLSNQEYELGYICMIAEVVSGILRTELLDKDRNILGEAEYDLFDKKDIASFAPIALIIYPVIINFFEASENKENNRPMDNASRRAFIYDRESGKTREEHSFGDFSDFLNDIIETFTSEEGDENDGEVKFDAN